MWQHDIMNRGRCGAANVVFRWVGRCHAVHCQRASGGYHGSLAVRPLKAEETPTAVTDLRKTVRVFARACPDGTVVFFAIRGAPRHVWTALNHAALTLHE